MAGHIPKRPFFIDLVHGTVGRFIKTKPATGEGMVFPVYAPLGSMKSRKYPYKVPKEAVTDPMSFPEEFSGIPDQIVFLLETTDDERPVIDSLGELQENRVAELRRRKEEAEWRERRERRERKQSEDRFELAKQQREQKQRKRRRDDRRDRGKGKGKKRRKKKKRKRKNRDN
jgi:hypothetical protein